MIERFLSVEQAEGLKERAREMMHEAILKGEWDDDYETLFWDAIAEATVRPGDAGFCEVCDWWSPYVDMDTPGTFQWPCKHKDAREGHCPKNSESGA